MCECGRACVVSYLHDEGEGGREESHEDHKVGDDGHGTEPANDLKSPGPGDGANANQ